VAIAGAVAYPDGPRLGLKYRISYQTHVTGLENVY
jgi:hypothetical protein